ncbi:hypothetical protein [Mycobacterium intracellulare]|uniref:hypothetical protein n=1 Tax=Mycobacterium intracellulare TaxID=1767 RepID=UPI001EEE5757|nr:hypothetical protein [Mycobacterium intracellulare]MEE3753359.1 hypothetical protein [Mycobacterium intracellulare]
MGRDDARLLLKALCSVAAILAATVSVGQHTGSAAIGWNAHWLFVRHCLLSRKNIAVEIQAMGALVAFYGLLRAYVRATYAQSVSVRIVNGIKMFWGRLLRLPQTITVPTIQSTAKFGRVGVTQTPPAHIIDITQSLDEQVKRLVQYVNDRTGEASEMAINITKLRLDIDGVKDTVTELERNMKAHTATQIQTFDRNLDSRQALDLTWAIWGLLVSFVGTASGFGT